MAKDGFFSSVTTFPQMISHPFKRLWFFLAAVALILGLLLILILFSIPPTLPHFPHSTPHQSRNLTFGTSPIILVSAFFPLKSSKHSSDEYAGWLPRYLSQITTPVVFYTTKSFAPTIKRLRGDLPVQIHTDFDSPFEVPPLRGLEEAYERQNRELDPEGRLHNAELYATWNGKAWFLNHTATYYSSEATEYLFWSDAGAFRQPHTFSEWPDYARVDKVFSTGSRETRQRKEELIYIPTWSAPPATREIRSWTEVEGPMNLKGMAEAGLFGGKLNGIRWWTNTFYALHDRYLSEGRFVGKEQDLFNTILFLHPDRVITSWVHDPRKRLEPVEQPSSPRWMCHWHPAYYYIYWLASAAEQNILLAHMEHEFNQFSWIKKIGSWLDALTDATAAGECRMLRVWGFRELLDDTVGPRLS